MIWYNDHGGRMTITELDINLGTFRGTYRPGPIIILENEYLLLGRFDPLGETMGWVVSWQNQSRDSHSTTSWSGQAKYDPTIDDFVLLTNWLRTEETIPENDWNSTSIGHDTFRRLEPTKEQTTRATLRFQRSHPKNA